ncbi:MAG: PorV/PorQ family protein [Calditrichaeota bacterium]|nr:PorV/PorQ family protein [Calditrichota bacterium]
MGRRKLRTTLLTLLTVLSVVHLAVGGQKKRVGQSGMAYLDITMSARAAAMGDAATATVTGIDGLWHNPGVVADVPDWAAALHQVNWLVDSKLYGVALAKSLGNFGAVGVDLTYMDYGDFVGTRPVDRAVDPRGFVITRKFRVEDYAVGFTFARRVSNKFTFGFRLKRLHENLGPAAYVVDEYQDPETGEMVRVRRTREWELNDWGLDFGTAYDVGWKSLRIAMTMQNFSRDMKYWFEEFQTPMTLRIGLAMDVAQLLLPSTPNVQLKVALDATHPNDYTERVHAGAEFLYSRRLALRVGYKFNHDVESAAFGVGTQVELAGLSAEFDYAYCAANYFKDIHRLSFRVRF